MFMVWTAVHRISRNGVVIGPDQRVDVWTALKAITINAAYQYFEEDIKGSLEVGKLADMVVLSENPLTVDPMKIRDITIEETIKEGQSVYRRG
jgi:predicted amidohydrolase YtcJ